MKIGVRAHDYGRHEIEEYAQLLAREGYETVQLTLPKAFVGVESYADITPGMPVRIREAFEKYHVEIAVQGCYQDLANPDEEGRLAAVDTLKKCLAYGKEMGAKMTGTETSWPHLSRMEKVRRFPLMMDSLKRLAEEACRLDTWLAIEPVAWHPLEDADTAAEVLHELNCDHVKIIFDPANVLPIPGLIRQDAYWKHCFEVLRPWIEAIHIKDFTLDEKGQYVPKLLGEGDMEYEGLSQFLKTRPDMPVLREEMDPKAAGADLAFLRKLKEAAV